MMIAEHSLKFISSPRIELARHEATQGKYTPKPSENAVKSQNTINTYTTPIHILKYILININLLRERIREEREGREKNERERW